jgi:hypothetical protein
MSCSAQAHITALRRKMASSTTSWTQMWEGPAVAMTATTRQSEVCVAMRRLLHYSFIKILVNSFVDDLWWISINCGALCWIAVKYVDFVSILTCFGGSRSGEVTKTGSSKNEINSLLNWRIYVPMCPVNSSVNWQTYGPCSHRGLAPGQHRFVG